MVPKPLGWSFQVQASLLVILMGMVSGSTASAQDDDDTPPYDAVATRLEFRNTAETPVPFGLVASGNLALVATPTRESQDETGTDAEFEIAFYYDVWQVAFRHRPYGNVVQIMSRSTGRDIYSGGFMEFGSVDFVEQNGGRNRTDTTIHAGTFSLGYRWFRGYSSHTSLAQAGEISFVSVYRTAGFLVKYGAGVRIPFGLSGLVACIQLRYSIYDWEQHRPLYVNDAQSQIGLGLVVQYGLNSEF